MESLPKKNIPPHGASTMRRNCSMPNLGEVVGLIFSSPSSPREIQRQGRAVLRAGAGGSNRPSWQEH